MSDFGLFASVEDLLLQLWVKKSKIKRSSRSPVVFYNELIEWVAVSVIENSAHSMRVTIITTVMGNGATLDDVQCAAGHAEPGAAQLDDRRGYNPEKTSKLLCHLLN